MRVMLFMKPLKQYFAASVGLLMALQRGALPPAAAAVLHSVSRQTSVTRESVAGVKPLSVGPEADLPGASHEYGHRIFAPNEPPVPVPGALPLLCSHLKWRHFK